MINKCENVMIRTVMWMIVIMATTKDDDNYGAPFVSNLFLAVDYLLLYKLVLLFRLGTSNLMFFGQNWPSILLNSAFYRLVRRNYLYSILCMFQ